MSLNKEVIEKNITTGDTFIMNEGEALQHLHYHAEHVSHRVLCPESNHIRNASSDFREYAKYNVLENKIGRAWLLLCNAAFPLAFFSESSKMILAFIADDYNANDNIHTSCCTRSSGKKVQVPRYAKIFHTSSNCRRMCPVRYQIAKAIHQWLATSLYVLPEESLLMLPEDKPRIVKHRGQCPPIRVTCIVTSLTQDRAGTSPFTTVRKLRTDGLSALSGGNGLA